MSSLLVLDSAADVVDRGEPEPHDIEDSGPRLKIVFYSGTPRSETKSPMTIIAVTVRLAHQ
ncbi:hypothetical protein ACVGOW_21525 [Pseudonocardia saturnea]